MDEDEYYVIDVADFIKTVNDLKKKTRADADYSREFKLGSDFAFNLLLTNYSDVIELHQSKFNDNLH